MAGKSVDLMYRLAEISCFLIFAVLVGALVVVFAVDFNLIDREGAFGQLVLRLLTDYKAATYGVFLLLTVANGVLLACAKRMRPAEETEESK